MTDRDLQARFHSIRPDMPEAYIQQHDRLMDRLIRGREGGAVRRRMLLRIAFIVLLLAASFTALALTNRLNLLSMLTIHEGNRNPVSDAAGMLVRQVLASHRFPHTEVTIREAVYDGRILRALYSVRDLAATRPFAPEGTPLPGSFSFENADRDGIRWKELDDCIVDGQSAMPVGYSGPVAGAEPGEVLTLVQFDLAGMELSDPFTVLLPITGDNTPESLVFSLSSVDLPGVRSLPAPSAMALADRTIAVTRITWSPIRVYIDMEIEMAPGVPEPVCHEALWRWTLEAELLDGESKAAYPLADTATGYRDNTEMDPDAGDFRHRILDPAKPVTIGLHLEFASPGDAPSSLILRAGEESVRIAVPQDTVKQDIIK